MSSDNVEACDTFARQVPLFVLLLAVRVGAAFSDAWSKLAPSYVAVEAGATVWRQRFAVVDDGAFTGPSAADSGGDVAGALFVAGGHRVTF